MKKYLIGVVTLILIVGGVYYFVFKKVSDEKSTTPNELVDSSSDNSLKENDDNTIVDEKVVQLSIDSISGPTSLKIGETGKWTANITAPTGANLKYQIEWGGEGEDGIEGPFSVLYDQSKPISFSHTYAYLKPYDYTLLFKVWDTDKCSPILSTPFDESHECVISSTIKVSVGN